MGFLLLRRGGVMPHSQDQMAKYRSVAHLLDEEPPDILNRLTRMLTSEDPQLRAAAIYAIGEYGDDSVLNFIKGALKDQDEICRVESIETLVVLKCRDIFHICIEGLKDPSFLVREKCCYVLGEIGDREAIPYLKVLLNDQHPDVRFSTSCSLAFLKDNYIYERLLVFLKDNPKRYQTVVALGRLGDRRAIEPLMKLSRKWFLHPIEKLEIASSLFMLGEFKQLSYIEKKLSSRRKDERGYAIELLGKLGISKHFGYLASIAQDSNDYHQDMAIRSLGYLGNPKAIDILINLLDAAEDDEIKCIIIESVAALADRRIEEKLNSILTNSKSPPVRRCIRHALRQISSKTVS